MRNPPVPALALILLALGGAPASAVVPAVPGQTPLTDADISVAVHADGRVSAWIMAPRRKALHDAARDDREWAEAFGRFLGGAVEEKARPYADNSRIPFVYRQFDLVAGVRRDGWVNFLELDPAPVLTLLRRTGVRRLHLSVRVDDKQGFSECTLAAPQDPSAPPDDGPEPPDDQPEVAAARHRSALWLGAYGFDSQPLWFFQQPTNYHYDLRVTEPVRPFRVAYGYRPDDFVLLAPLALLPVPLLWTLWRRRRVLARPAGQSDGAWWGYSRSLRRTEVGLALFWAFVFVGTPAGALLDRLAHQAVGLPATGSVFVGWDLLSLAVYALPPAAVGFLCAYLSFPVYTRVRGLEWTRSDMAGHALRRHVAPWFGLLLVAAAVAALANVDLRRAVGWLAGFALVTFLLPRLGRVTARRVLQPLETGVVRDRVFELAQKAGVKVNQVYLWPTRHDRTANAAAAVGNKVLLTDYLLEHMSRRQVDWVIAHELVHLRHNHAGKFIGAGGSWVIIVLLWMVVAVTPAIDLSPGFQAVVNALVLCRYGFLLLLVLGVVWVGNFRKRRYEFVADGEAVGIVGGDVEAAVTALVKLSRLNAQPEEWGRLDGVLLTHPSEARRVDAILDDNDVDPERLPAMIAAVDRDADRYPLPANLLHEEAVLFKESRARRGSVLWWSVLTDCTLVPAVLAAGMDILSGRGVPWWAAAAGVVVLSAAFLWNVTAYTAVWDERRLRARLVARWKGEGIDVEAARGVFLALAPSRAQRLYESGFDWDTGFLFFTSERLFYLGCQTRFALPRDRVKAVWLGPGPPRWGKSAKVYFTWCDDAGTPTTWNLRPAGFASVPGMQRQVPHLLLALQEWHRGESPAAPAPEPLVALPPPAVGPVTCLTVAKFLEQNPLQRQLTFYAAGAAGLAFLFGCSFDLPPTPGWGWYAPALTCLTALFQRTPLWLYREPRPPRSSKIPFLQPVDR